MKEKTEILDNFVLQPDSKTFLKRTTVTAPGRYPTTDGLTIVGPEISDNGMVGERPD